MKHLKQLIFYLMVIVAFTPQMRGQTSINSGAIITNSVNSGSSETSIGQLFYQQNQTGNTIEFQGVIQPLSTEVLSVDETSSLALESKVFPNPTSNNVQLHLKEFNGTLTYKVYNMIGKQMLYNRIEALETTIPLSGMATGVYVLHILQDNKPIKTVKIIKQ